MAAPADWQAVAGLLVELGRGVAVGTANDPTHQLVAADDAEVLGMIDMEYHQRLGDHRPQARVNDLVVTDRARGRGVGGALLTRAEELARRRGCFRMALVTAAWGDATIAFYERQGWRNYGEWFVKPLTGDVGPGGEPIRDDN